MDRMTVAQEVLAANTPTQLFGSDPDEARRRFKRYARELHPDVGGDPAAFAHLSTLYQRLTHPARGITLVSAKHSYDLGSLAAKGDVANLYCGTYDAGRNEVLVKMTRSPSNNDLLTAEAKHLTAIIEKGDVRWIPFVAPLIDTFRHRDETGAERRVNVFRKIDGLYSLSEVAREYTHGVDSRDIAWMWRRLLIAIGVTHDNGVVHGSPLGSHVLIHPAKHGLVLTGWGQSVRVGERIRALPSEPFLWPDEIGDKLPATPATDIYVAAKTMATLGGARLVPPFRAHFQGCGVLNPRARPQSAWQVLVDFDELIERVWGRRTFHEFRMATEPAI